MKRDFLTLWDFDSGEIERLLGRAIEFKKGLDKARCPLLGKSVGLIFEKASTRTRVSFEAAVYQLGGHSIYMNPHEIQLNRGETIQDTAKVLSRYLNGIILRTFEHSKLEEFGANSSVPVINGLSDRHHPCQTLGDLMTILERKGRLEGVRVAYIGDGNNVASSLIEGASRMGMHLALACPEGFEPDPTLLERARAAAKSEILLVREPKEAAGRADVVYTDVWVSMGEEEKAREKRKKFARYQVNENLLSCARADAIVMHCLPAHRGEEITSGVMDGPMSAIFEQAENRLHTEKALLEFLLT